MTPSFEAPNAPVPPPSQPPTPLPRQGFSWGIIGTNTYERLSQGSRSGVIRKGSGPGLSYHAPPLPFGSLTWSDVGDSRFEMAVDARVAAAEVQGLSELGVRSVDALREELARLGRDTPVLLRDLDTFAGRLLELVDYLHQQGCYVGLLHPCGVLLKGTGPDLGIILPDLGFVRDGNIPGKRPAWLDITKPLWQDWRDLFTQDELSDSLQLIDAPQPDRPPQFGQGPVSNPVPDLRRVAWLFVWLLLGRAYRTVPTPDEEPSTYAPAWNVLREVVIGRVKTARQFREELCKTPLSDHFRSEKTKRRRAWGWWLGTAATLLLFMGGLAGAALWGYRYVTHDAGASAHTGTLADPTPLDRLGEGLGGSRLEGKVKQFQEAATLDARYAAFMDACRSRRSADGERYRRELAALQSMRSVLLAALADRLSEIICGGQDLDEGEQVARRLRELPSDETSLLTKEKEQQCLTDCLEWIGQRRAALFGG